ncbi:MAG: hypothetical protein HY721_08245, partial [Planctomycetes bacterium]|nr:hypothetical protein [Planctomycetota bacterium]
LEMNTRIQVEHPVTEVTSGVDLVGEQVEIARGKRLPRWRGGLAGHFVEPRGAAMELRLNAEDPAEGFRPSTGRITSLRLPTAPWVRVDCGVEAGSEVTPFYDSLLAKVIAWGPTRGEAMARLEGALRETVVGGVATTVPLGLALLADEGFRAARNHCQYLAERLEEPSFFPGMPPEEELPLLAAAAAWISRARSSSRPAAAAAMAAAASPGSAPAAPPSPAAASPWAQRGRWRDLP